MKGITASLAAVTLFCLYAAAAFVPDRPERAPQEIDPKVVEAWKKAGAIAGWYKRDEYGGWVSEFKPNDPALPAFHWRSFDPRVIAKVPAPSAPFALLLRFTEVTDAGMKEIARFKSLQTLELRYTKVTDAGLKEIAGLRNLQTLDLYNTMVTDAGMKEIAGLASLQILNLGGTQVSDTGLKELAALKSLQTLGLFATQVTDAGVAQLQSALPKLRVSR
jgi:internalin A